MPRELRQAHNRMLFREVNDRIADLSSSLGVAESLQGFICECNRLGCIAQVEVPLSVYASVRDTPSAFLVLAGHENPEHEQIVGGQGGGYVIVRPREN